MSKKTSKNIKKQASNKRSVSTKKAATRKAPPKRKKSASSRRSAAVNAEIEMVERKTCRFCAGAIICGVIINAITIPNLITGLNSSDTGVGSAMMIGYGIIFPISLFVIGGLIFLCIAWQKYAKLVSLGTHNGAIRFWNIIASLSIIAPLIFIGCFSAIHQAYLNIVVDDSSAEEGINEYLQGKYSTTEKFVINKAKFEKSVCHGAPQGQCTYDVKIPNTDTTFHVVANRPTIWDKWSYDDENSYGLQKYNIAMKDYYTKVFADHNIAVAKLTVSSHSCRDLDAAKSLEDIKNDNKIVFRVSVYIPVTVDANGKDIYRDYVDLYRTAGEPAQQVFDQYKTDNTVLQINALANNQYEVHWSPDATAEKRKQMPCDSNKQIETY